MVPARAMMADSGLTNRAMTAAAPPPSHGPMMGRMFSTPVMPPMAAALGTPMTVNSTPQATPMMRHWMRVPLM